MPVSKRIASQFCIDNGIPARITISNPNNAGMLKGIRILIMFPDIFPNINDFLLIPPAKINFSVPDSRSPFIASYVIKMAISENTTWMRNTKSTFLNMANKVSSS